MICYWERKEEAWDNYFAGSDSIRERYAAEIEDMKQDALASDAWYEYLHQVESAGFGDDTVAYEASWRRTFAYANSGAVDDLLEK
jgi:hypothetical protein